MTKIRSEKVTLVDLREIKLNPKNRNKHPDDQIDRLAKIIEYQGFRIPITISNQTGYCVAGEGRYLAAKKLGLKQIPAIFQDFDDEDQEIAFGISDNGIAAWAELDFSGINSDLLDMGPFDIELLGLRDFEAIAEDKLQPGCDEDEMPEKVEPKTKRGDIYKLGNHRLMCGDSACVGDVDELMNGEKPDLVFTDPPYGISYSATDDNKPNATKFTKIIGDETTPGLSIVFAMECMQIIWGANYFPELLPHRGRWACWDKRSDADIGPKADGMLGSDFELAWLNKQSGYDRIFRIMHGGVVNKDGGKRVHPTQKPTQLAIDCIDYYKKEAINIVDLFGGSGSTLIACEKTGRKCLMMEIDPKYCDVIIARWEKYTGKKAELLSQHGDDANEPIAAIN